MINNNQINNRPSLIQTIGAVLTAGVMWGSANVIIRSLLIEGLNEIFLVTVRVSIIGTLLFFYYVILNLLMIGSRVDASDAVTLRL